jgi:hypothetical protein
MCRYGWKGRVAMEDRSPRVRAAGAIRGGGFRAELAERRYTSSAKLQLHLVTEPAARRPIWRCPFQPRVRVEVQFRAPVIDGVRARSARGRRPSCQRDRAPVEVDPSVDAVTETPKSGSQVKRGPPQLDDGRGGVKPGHRVSEQVDRLPVRPKSRHDTARNPDGVRDAGAPCHLQVPGRPLGSREEGSRGDDRGRGVND